MKAVGMIRPAAAEYWGIAEELGANSREWAEAVGFSQIDEAFLTKKVDTAYWISPPSIGQQGFGNYGFLFVFKKSDDDQVYVKIHRYEQENTSLNQSNSIMQLLSIKHKLSGFDTTKDPLRFLQHPLLLSGVSDIDVSQDIVDIVNLGQVNFISDKIAFQKAVQFQEKVIEHPLIMTWMNNYAQDILIATDDHVDIISQKTAMTRAEKTRKAIFNLAQELYYGTHQPNTVNPYNDRFLQQQVMEFQYPIVDVRQNYYTQKPAMIIGGGSCPVSSQDSTVDVLLDSNKLLDRGVLNYQTASELSKKRNYHNGDCVHCHAKNIKVGPCNICQDCERLSELN